MSVSVASKSISTTYNSDQNCTPLKEPQGKTVTMDCPYTGKGEELSPTNLVEAALGGCMLLSMGTLAMRNRLDISGARMDVKISSTDRPVMRFSTVDVTVKMPRAFSTKDRSKLERAADACPIKHSFDPGIPISIRWEYPE